MADLQMFVPLFVTANVDIRIIENLIETASKALDENDEDGDGRNIAELVLITTNVPENISNFKAQSKGIRPPISSFESPYLNASDEYLTEIFLKHLDGLTPNWSESVFVIADAETAKEGKSVSLVYPKLKGTSPSEGREPESVRIDFVEVLRWSIEMNVGNACIPELVNCVGPDGYITTQSMEEARAREDAP